MEQKKNFEDDHSELIKLEKNVKLAFTGKDKTTIWKNRYSLKMSRRQVKNFVIQLPELRCCGIKNINKYLSSVKGRCIQVLHITLTLKLYYPFYYSVALNVENLFTRNNTVLEVFR